MLSASATACCAGLRVRLHVEEQACKIGYWLLLGTTTSDDDDDDDSDAEPSCGRTSLEDTGCTARR